MATQVTLGKREYWHGTNPAAAACILHEGFRLNRPWRNRGSIFRGAFYLTKTIQIATCFGKYLFKCRLLEGTRILRIDGTFDKKVIEYLRREFGADLLDLRFDNSLPRNKRLSKMELVAILNYALRDHKAILRLWKRPDWSRRSGEIRKQLRLHKCDGLGREHDIYGIAVFNPSRVRVGEPYYENQETETIEQVDLDALMEDVREWLAQYRVSSVEEDRVRISLQELINQRAPRQK